MLNNQLQSPMMRLITSSLGVIAAAHDGTLFHQKSEAQIQKVVDALDRLEEDTELAVKSLPKEVSPFMRYRMEILGNTVASINLRYLICHLSGDKTYQYFDIARVLQELNAHHANIALELIQGFAINPNDATFLLLIDSVKEITNTEDSVAGGE